LDWFDLAILGVLTWNTVSAFRRGLIREAVSIVALIAGAVLAGRYYDELSTNLSFVIDDETTRNLVAFVSIFLGINLVGAVASMFLRNAAAVLMLGPMDHLGGAVFGLLRGILFVEVILVAVTMFPAANSLTAGAEHSTLAPYFLRAAPFVNRLLPEAFHEAIETLKTIATPSATPTAP
jgi:membrane protein required for colicin V production